jgi:hypothetical protein
MWDMVVKPSTACKSWNCMFSDNEVSKCMGFDETVFMAHFAAILMVANVDERNIDQWCEVGCTVPCYEVLTEKAS